MRHPVRGIAHIGDGATAERAYPRLAGLMLLNPATVVYFVALAVGTRSIGTLSPVQGVVFGLAAFTTSASWHLTLAGGGAAMGRLLTGRRGRLATAARSSMVIAVFAVSLAVSAVE
jgi:arginine exporter protein ArgO